MKEIIKNYENEKNKKITEEKVKYLYENIDRADELKKEYREVLEELNIYDNNYYAKICIIINALKFKKKQGKRLKLPYDIYYLNLPIRGVLQTVINGEKHQIKTVEKLIEYETINKRCENIGEEKTKREKLKLIKQAKEILNDENNLIKKGIEWKIAYKKYIIRTYGRMSQQYEDYMTTLFDIGFLPTAPNLLLKINKEHIKKAIQEKLKDL